MKRPLSFAAASLLVLTLSACATTAEPPAAAEPAAQAAAPVEPAAQSASPAETGYANMVEANKAAKDDDLICSREQVMGSRFKKKTCATRAERELAQKRAQEELSKATGRGAPVMSR